MGSVSARAGERAGVIVATGAQRVVEAGETFNGRSRSTVDVSSKTGDILGKRQSARKEASEEEQRGHGERIHCWQSWLGYSI